MNSYPKLKEYTKEEIHEQIINGDIDHDFICEYISKRDKVYNELIDEIDDLQKKINKAKEYYLHELFKREQLGIPTKMPYESVEMFNILEGNK